MGYVLDEEIKLIGDTSYSFKPNLTQSWQSKLYKSQKNQLLTHDLTFFFKVLFAKVDRTLRSRQ